MKYQIYQLPIEHKALYRGVAKEAFDINNYKLVYEGEVELDLTIDQILEHLFEKFNIAKPDDFKGHSLSVSDIIKLNDKYYQVESIGFQEF